MSKKPNIIFLLTDDQRYDTFGFMGNKYIHTPNIDKLAHDGVFFDNSFHVAPICMPSRASIQLGRYISEHRCGFDLPTDYTITIDEYQQSYPSILRKNGYYTGFIGKFGFPISQEKKHHETREAYMLPNLNEPLYKGKNTCTAEDDSLILGEFDVWNGFVHGQGQYTPLPDGTFNHYENPYGVEHLNEFMTCQGLDFIRKGVESEKPFALSISYKAPHRPFVPAKKWKEFYKDMDIPRQFNDKPEYFEKLPKVVREHSRNAEEYWGRYTAPSMADRPWKVDEYYKQDIRDYYALISGVDESVGILREELEKLGIAENTVIIYTSDNGFFFGSKQIGGKELLYEESIRAPMVIFDPRLDESKRHKSIKGMISHIDISATILDYAGLDKAENNLGESIIPLINGDKVEIHDAVYGENDYNNKYQTLEECPNPEEYQSIRSKYVRTTEYKYIRYHECHPVVEELLAIKNDPLEINNLIDNPEFKEIADKMRSMLNEFEKSFI